MLGIAIVSQGVHDIAIEHLGVPYPTLVNPPGWLPVLGDVTRSLFLIFFCLIARKELDRLSLIRAAALVDLLEICLSETFRISTITFFMVNDCTIINWMVLAIDLPTRMCAGLTLGSPALIVSRIAITRRSIIVIFFATVTVGMMTRLAIVPLTKNFAEQNLTSAGIVRPDGFYRTPYGPGMLSIIYGTFLEPTIATFVMARLSGRGLPQGCTEKILAFALVILDASGRITRLLLDSFWVQQPPALAFASTAQFFVENAVMSVLVALLCMRREVKGKEPYGSSNEEVR